MIDELIRELCKEDVRFWDTEVPADEKEKEDLLRTLLNQREPKPVSEELLRMQDAYLAGRLSERGIVDAAALPAVRGDPRIVLWQGDITRLKADVIVNAANSRMLGCFTPLHPCVDNCIHTYAGVQLRLACDRQMRRIREKLGESYLQPTGIPMLTDAFNLPAKQIAHVVGPVVTGEVTAEQEAQLASCYRNVLTLCRQRGVESVAFCCLSAGDGGFPGERAAEIAVRTVKRFLDENGGIGRVVFVVFEDADRKIYSALLDGET